MKLRSLTTLLLVLLLILPAVFVHPAQAATFKKLSVSELKDLLTTFHTTAKTDEQVAAQLRAIELTEELTPTTMHALTRLIPGPLSTEQLFVLEAGSSMLPPPPTDLPNTPPPDPTAQQSLLAKAKTYTTNTYAQLPPLTASRMTARFQDGVKTISTLSGANLKTVDDQDPVQGEAHIAIRLANTHTDTVQLHHGLTQQLPKEKVAWGTNGLVASTLPPIPLPELLNEITTNGNPTWLRWQLIHGKPAAVFSFSVDKKKSHYTLNYCCFPDTSSVGNVLYSGSAAHPVNNGNLSTVSDFKPFTTKSGYHGELYLDLSTGAILRTIVEASFKPSDFVHSERLRVDYGAIQIANQPLIVPIRTVTLAEIVPNADSFAAHYATRHDLVTEDFKDFTPAEK